MSKPIVIFAKSPGERDYLRNLLTPKNVSLLCFEEEATCFDNLASIDPQLILIGTDSSQTVWRFVLAIDALKIDSGLLLLSDRLDTQRLDIISLNVTLRTLPKVIEPKLLSDYIDGMLIKNKSGKRETRHGFLLGSTPAIRRVCSKLPSLIQTSDSVLIEGERGTGKELLARMIAQQADSMSSFIKIDCEAIAAGKSNYLLESAYEFNGEIYKMLKMNGAKNKPITVLLSKIDRLDLKAQSEILFLWEKNPKITHCNLSRHADLRLIATAEAGLPHLVRQKRFRKDLFYRLNVIPIRMPALRERKDDIPLLMDHFILQASARLKRSFMFPTNYLAERISAYAWPGNLDDLKRLMNRLAASGNEAQLLRELGFHKLKQNPNRYLYNALGTDDFPDSLEIQNCLATMDGPSLKSICNKFTHKTEKKLLKRALEITNWNRKKAAALLDISYKSMLNKMKMYEII